MADPLDLTSYVARVAAILGDTPGAHPDTRQRANVLARRVVEALRDDLTDSQLRQAALALLSQHEPKLVGDVLRVVSMVPGYQIAHWIGPLDALVH
jgi:hypothetical protein